MKIGLDSTVFRKRKFIEWLIVNRNQFEIHISIIVYIETLLWYKLLDLGIEDFEDDLRRLNAEVISIDEKLADLVTNNAIRFKEDFPFKFHARDYVIGSSAVLKKAMLITDNIKHFNWLSKIGIEVKTPEEFVHLFETEKKFR